MSFFGISFWWEKKGRTTILRVPYFLNAPTLMTCCSCPFHRVHPEAKRHITSDLPKVRTSKASRFVCSAQRKRQSIAAGCGCALSREAQELHGGGAEAERLCDSSRGCFNKSGMQRLWYPSLMLQRLACNFWRTRHAVLRLWTGGEGGGEALEEVQEAQRRGYLCTMPIASLWRLAPLSQEAHQSWTRVKSKILTWWIMGCKFVCQEASGRHRFGESTSEEVLMRQAAVLPHQRCEGRQASQTNQRDATTPPPILPCRPQWESAILLWANSPAILVS